MRNSELSRDGKTWTIPPSRTKNKTTHIVPLPPLARQIIAEAVAASSSQSQVFVGSRGKPLRADTLLHALSDAIDEHNAQQEPNEQIAEFVVHDLRRTLASSLEIMGTPGNVIAAALNHISAKNSSVTGRHYLHGDLKPAIHAALTEWQGNVEAILAGGDPLTPRAEDMDDVEARILAKGKGGVSHLRLVS